MGENPLKTYKTKYIKQGRGKTARTNAGYRGKKEKSKTVLQEEGGDKATDEMQHREGLQTAHAG
jgi:hypothetical protein